MEDIENLFIRCQHTSYYPYLFSGILFLVYLLAIFETTFFFCIFYEQV